MRPEYIIAIVFILGLIAGVAGVLSYFFETGFLTIFALCFVLFVVINLIIMAIFHFLTRE